MQFSLQFISAFPISTRRSRCSPIRFHSALLSNNRTHQHNSSFLSYLSRAELLRPQESRALLARDLSGYWPEDEGIDGRRPLAAPFRTLHSLEVTCDI